MEYISGIQKLNWNTKYFVFHAVEYIIELQEYIGNTFGRQKMYSTLVRDTHCVVLTLIDNENHAI